MPLTKLNFIFIRHGQGCHNVVAPLFQAKLIRYNEAMNFSKPEGKFPIIDPELTTIGVISTIQNAKVLKKMLVQQGISDIHLVVSSPLIRAMETAYYTKREFERELAVVDTKREFERELAAVDTKRELPIYVAPYLREVDESSGDPKSKSSRKVIDTIPAYAMIPLKNQMNYLKEEGILEHYNFDYLDPTLRTEPGDISDFFNWLENSKLLPTKLEISKMPEINILVVTHAGVLHNHTGESFPNNGGFIETINGVNDPVIKILDNKKFKPAMKLGQKSLCPSMHETSRCNSICTLLSPPEPIDSVTKVNPSAWNYNQSSVIIPSVPVPITKVEKLSLWKKFFKK